MLDFRESQKVQILFGANEAQVNRDHAISHVLAALQKFETEFIFFGGTALARIFLSEGRLSEDIDLYTSDRRALCRELEKLSTLITEEFPQASWNVGPSRTVDPQSSLLICNPSIQIRVQVLDSLTRGWQFIPTIVSEIQQRYSDAPLARLFTPTFDGFVAMKALAWVDRCSPRDLFDLAGLSRKGQVTEDARELIEQLRGFQISAQMMDLRVKGLWQEELAHQTQLHVTAEDCLQRVLEWWSK